MSLTIKNDRSVSLSKDVLVSVLHSYLRSQNVSPLPPADEISVKLLVSSTELATVSDNADVIEVKWST